MPVALQRRHLRGAALLARQACARGAQDGRFRGGVQGEVRRGELPVRAGRRSVEEQREAIRRPDLAEDDGRVQGVIDAEPARVYRLTRKKVADELAVSVVANFADDGGAHLLWSQAGAGVAGEAAHVSDVVPLLAQWGSDLCRVDVGAEPAHHDDLGPPPRPSPASGGGGRQLFFQSISHSWSGSVVKSHSRTSPAIAFR